MGLRDQIGRRKSNYPTTWKNAVKRKQMLVKQGKEAAREGQSTEKVEVEMDGGLP